MSGAEATRWIGRTWARPKDFRRRGWARRRALGGRGDDRRGDGVERGRGAGLGEREGRGPAADRLAELAVPARPRVAGPGLAAMTAHGVLGAALFEGGSVAFPPARLHAPEARHQHVAGRLIRRRVVECVRTAQRGLPFGTFDGLESLAALGFSGFRLRNDLVDAESRCRIGTVGGRRIAPPYSRIAHAEFGCKRYNRIGWRFLPPRGRTGETRTIGLGDAGGRT